MYDAELIERLDSSHTDLIRVCQAAFALILEHELLEGMDGLLILSEVQPGFAERASEIQREMSFTRIRAI